MNDGSRHFRYGCEPSGGGGTFDGQCPVGLVEFVCESFVLASEVVGKAEELHFLGCHVAGRDITQIVELPALRRPFVEQRVRETREVRLPDERRQYGKHEHQQEPAVEGDERGKERNQGQTALPDAEQYCQQPDPPDGLPAGSLQRIVELRVLEVLQIQGGRVLHDPHRQTIAEQIAEKALEKIRRAL